MKTDMNLNIYGDLAYAKTIAASAGLSICQEGDKWQPRTDGRRIYMPTKMAWGLNDPKTIMWDGALLHECRHVMPENRDDFQVIKEKKIHMQSLLGFAVNLVLDYQIEHNPLGEYRGRDRIASRCQTLLRTEGLEQWEEPTDELGAASNALFMWDSLTRTDWMPDMAGTDWLERVPKSDRKLLDSLDTVKDELNNPLDSEGRYELALKILGLLGLDPQEQEQTSQEMYEMANQGEKQLTQEEFEEMLEGLSDEEKEKLKAQVDAVVKFKDMQMHEHGDDGTSYHKLTIDYSDPEDASTGYKLSPVEVHDFVRGLNVESLNEDGYYHSELSQLGDSNAMSTQIKNYLLTLKTTRWTPGKRTGRVNRKSVWKTAVYGGRPEAQEIFRQKSKHLIQDSAISVVVDGSGSMGGSKYIHAVHSALLLNDVFTKINIPVEIISFTEGDNIVYNTIHKTFDTHRTKDQLVSQFARMGSKLWANADGESILWAAERLRGRKEKNKVMIVLSDGQPACSGWGNEGRWDIYHFTKEVIKNLSQVIDIYGIGIEDNTVQEFYPEWTVIESSSELETTLLNLMKDKVLR